MNAILQAGALFAERYRVVRAIKAGGMGAVYEVTDETTNARRALKVLLPTYLADEEMRTRFSLEARVTGDIESDHIVHVFHAGVDGPTGMPFIVMELLRGEDLSVGVRAAKPLSSEVVMAYLTQVARALDKTHAANIVHRDLKPENLFLTTRDDGSPCVKILDYGIAKVLAQSQQQAHATGALGTPVYMAPEQVRGKGGITGAADIYALGHIAYALLVGETYWEEEKRSGESLFPLFQAIVAGPPETPVARAARRKHVDLPTGFDAWFAKATAALAEGRYASASEAVAALGPALETPTTRMIQVAAEVTAEGLTDQRVMPGRMVAAAIGVGALSFTFIAVGVHLRRESHTTAAAAKPIATASERAKEVEDVLFLASVGDVDAAHAALSKIPEDKVSADDPAVQRAEGAWADKQMKELPKADDAKKRLVLREIVANRMVDARRRSKAAKMLEELSKR